jgi:hypothetical protein
MDPTFVSVRPILNSGKLTGLAIQTSTARLELTREQIASFVEMSDQAKRILTALGG